MEENINKVNEGIEDREGNVILGFTNDGGRPRIVTRRDNINVGVGADRHYPNLNGDQEYQPEDGEEFDDDEFDDENEWDDEDHPYEYYFPYVILDADYNGLEQCADFDSAMDYAMRDDRAAYIQDRRSDDNDNQGIIWNKADFEDENLPSEIIEDLTEEVAELDGKKFYRCEYPTNNNENDADSCPYCGSDRVEYWDYYDGNGDDWEADIWACENCGGRWLRNYYIRKDFDGIGDTHGDNFVPGNWYTRFGTLVNDEETTDRLNDTYSNEIIESKQETLKEEKEYLSPETLQELKSYNEYIADIDESSDHYICWLVPGIDSPDGGEGEDEFGNPIGFFCFSSLDEFYFWADKLINNSIPSEIVESNNNLLESKKQIIPFSTIQSMEKSSDFISCIEDYDDGHYICWLGPEAASPDGWYGEDADGNPVGFFLFSTKREFDKKMEFVRNFGSEIIENLNEERVHVDDLGTFYKCEYPTRGDESDEFKCPYCGSDDTDFYTDWDYDGDYRIDKYECNNCGGKFLSYDRIETFFDGITPDGDPNFIRDHWYDVDGEPLSSDQVAELENTLYNSEIIE